MKKNIVFRIPERRGDFFHQRDDLFLFHQSANSFSVIPLPLFIKSAKYWKSSFSSADVNLITVFARLFRASRTIEALSKASYCCSKTISVFFNPSSNASLT